MGHPVSPCGAPRSTASDNQRSPARTGQRSPLRQPLGVHHGLDAALQAEDTERSRRTSDEGVIATLPVAITAGLYVDPRKQHSFLPPSKCALTTTRRRTGGSSCGFRIQIGKGKSGPPITGLLLRARRIVKGGCSLARKAATVPAWLPEASSRSASIARRRESRPRRWTTSRRGCLSVPAS
jgi:hypothetical protein